jgi:hypothetical protein
MHEIPCRGSVGVRCGKGIFKERVYRMIIYSLYHVCADFNNGVAFIIPLSSIIVMNMHLLYFIN